MHFRISWLIFALFNVFDKKFLKRNILFTQPLVFFNTQARSKTKLNTCDQRDNYL